MTIKEKCQLIKAEVNDLVESVNAYDQAAKQKGEKPYLGYGAKYIKNGYGTNLCVKEGLQQGSTATAIERKIVTIRNHLNELRKLVR